MKNRIIILIFVCLFISDVRAQSVQEAFLPAFREGKDIFDFESGQLIDLQKESDEFVDDDEIFRQIQKVGDLYYTSIRNQQDALTITTGIYQLLNDSRFESIQIYPVRQQSSGFYQIPLDHLDDKYIILQTRNKKKIAMHVLGISRLQLHICWIWADEKTGGFSEDDKQKLINFVKKQKLRREPISGETTLYDLHGQKANGFYFGDQKTIPLSYPKILSDNKKVNQLPRDELLELQKQISSIINSVDVSYETLNVNIPGGCYEVLFNQLDQLPLVVKNAIAARHSIVEPLLQENNVFLIKTIDAKYALIKIQSFDSEKLTFSWFYQPDGTANFPKAELESGVWNPPIPDEFKKGASLFDIIYSRNMSAQEKKEKISQAVKNGANVDTPRDHTGYTLLFAVIESYTPDPEMIQFLISLGADVNHKTFTGTSPLHSAAQFGHSKICEILLDHGADPTIVNNYGDTPLQLAMKEQYPRRNDKVIELLRKRTKPTTLFMASILCDTEATEKLIEEGLNPDDYDELGYTPLHHAVENKCAEVCEILIKNGANPELARKKDNSHKTALGQAASLRETEIVRLMLENYSFSEKGLGCALYESSYSGDPNSCQLLLDKGANPFFVIGNTPYLTPYFAAMRFGTKRVVDVYTRHGISMSLWAAVRLDMIDEVREMLLNEANVSAVSEEGYPVLYYAIINRNLGMVQLLLEKQPELDQIIKRDGKTLLHFAIQEKFFEVAQLLIKHGANVNLKDSLGRSPLYLAILENNYETTKILLEYGADQTIAPEGKPSCLGLAKQKKYTKIYSLLKQYEK